MNDHKIYELISENPYLLKDVSNYLFKRYADISENDPKFLFYELILNDFENFILNSTLNPIHKHFYNRKSVIHDGLAKIFPELIFEETEPELDHAGDVDYTAKVGVYAFGIQIKPTTAKSNFGNYSPSERMKASFRDFEDKFGGKVFIVYSLDGEIGNQDIVNEIKEEIERLKLL